MFRFCAAFFYISFFFLFVSQNLLAEKSQIVYVFRNFQSPAPEKMILVGEIQSKSKEPISPGQVSLEEYDTRMDRVTVKISNRKGLKKGQKLYIVDKNPHHDRFREGHMVGEIELVSIFYSPVYGSWVISGRGILLRVRKGQFAVRRMETESLERAFALSRRGVHYAESNQYAKAVESFREALAVDASLPEAYSALGRLYFENTVQKTNFVREPISSLEEALYSYERAWKYRKNFRYTEDEWEYCRSHIKALHHFYEQRKKKKRSGKNLVRSIVRPLDRSIEIGREALKLRPDRKFTIGKSLAKAHYYRMLYYSKQSNREERRRYDHSQKAADYWLKELLKMERKNGDLLSTAILFYGYRYYELRPNIVSDRQLRQRLRDMLLNKLSPYYNLYLNKKEEKRNPKVDKLLYKLYAGS